MQNTALKCWMFNFMPVPSIHTNNCHGILLVSKCNNILLTLMKPELSNWPLWVEIFRQHTCQWWKINRWIWAQAGKENWKQQICFNIEIKISSRVSKLCYKPKTAKPRMSWYQATPRVSNINHLKWIGVFFSQERKIKEKRNNLGNYFTVTKRETISRHVRSESRYLNGRLANLPLMNERGGLIWGISGSGAGIGLSFVVDPTLIFRLKTWIVPLSLDTDKYCKLFEKAKLYISALSAPLLT